MAFARFSDNDYQCDVYVYYDYDNKLRIHVAHTKYIYKSELPPKVSLRDLDAFTNRCITMKKLRGEADMMPIGLSRDGRHYVINSPGVAANILESLREEGYNVPETAITSLREQDRGCDLGFRPVVSIVPRNN